jgi:hypothetical protein
LLPLHGILYASDLFHLFWNLKRKEKKPASKL